MTTKETKINNLIVTIQEFEVHIIDIKQNILQPLLNKLQKLQTQLAHAHCPLAINDYISNGKITFIITKIEPDYCWQYKMFGYKLKKDNTPGIQLKELYFIHRSDIGTIWNKVPQPIKKEKQHEFEI